MFFSKLNSDACIILTASLLGQHLLGLSGGGGLGNLWWRRQVVLCVHNTAALARVNCAWPPYTCTRLCPRVQHFIDTPNRSGNPANIWERGVHAGLSCPHSYKHFFYRPLIQTVKDVFIGLFLTVIDDACKLSESTS